MDSDNSLHEVKRLYDERIKSSKDAIKAAGQWGSEEFVPLICEEIGKKIGITKNDKVLELGCGGGVLGNWIEKRCKLYVGVDISRNMLKFFLKNYNLQQPNLFQGTTEQVPLSNNIFDIVIINGVAMYFPSENTFAKTLQEMKRVATKNATIFIGENITSSEFPWELVWFQNLSPTGQFFAKPYIKLRKWLAKKNSKIAGKWKFTYKETSPKLINHYFASPAKITKSKAATFTVKKKIIGKKYKGSRRVDFVIKLDSKSDKNV